MKKVIPNLKMLAAAQDMSLGDLADKVNEIQRKAGYTKRPLSRKSLYRYKHEQPPEARVYALCAVLGVHPRKLFVDMYDEAQLEFYKNLVKSS